MRRWRATHRSIVFTSSHHIKQLLIIYQILWMNSQEQSQAAHCEQKRKEQPDHILRSVHLVEPLNCL
ncbi:hypothetical protein L596_029018 [Steinernema carpocapsae]|uniref:Uncharacterized protein n=1 Tax=Steinernema carpocapsae TaxID=34508 RepID=A0A4U5LTD9_STECR|nr:hypothetical protein L596_029018 [Steinernema carpocapsae]